jgi:hypothetical protein
LSEWESKALEAEERNRTLINSYKVSENTSKSKQQAESAPISDVVNDIYIKDKTIKVLISQSHIPDIDTPNNAIDDNHAIETNDVRVNKYPAGNSFYSAISFTSKF